MTCMEPAGRDGKAKVVPLRRFEGGVQTHPPPGQPHPWFLKRVSTRDSSDWLNNEFFFRAFAAVMAESGHRVEAPVHEIFDFRWNQDFRGREASEPTVRGGVMYQEPVGWKKFAIRVMGCFEGGNAWLRLDGSPGEWAVAYHGTNVDAMPAILCGGGMRVGERQAYKDFRDQRTGEQIGTGIYCTPSIETAAEFSPTVEAGGRRMQFVIQCRVRPAAIKRIHEEVGRESGAYWLINNPSDIRPYGVLARESPL
uniref:PARP catalytic domain-containing protein n=1 Tax=Zooxanthella nutricula TaxID=1333877 RepID=A0A7S2KLS0_9DINO|mmetsp:Transcript_49417/g.150366  ORF Transcript_49417/g.150366 Transcript_49417/m.150366 type:complete len:253 (+) Transcript_49417:2-760(+)